MNHYSATRTEKQKQKWSKQMRIKTQARSEPKWSRKKKVQHRRCEVRIFCCFSSTLYHWSMQHICIIVLFSLEMPRMRFSVDCFYGWTNHKIQNNLNEKKRKISEDSLVLCFSFFIVFYCLLFFNCRIFIFHSTFAEANEESKTQ